MPDAPAPAATAVRAILAALIRHLITVSGTALVARGWVDQSTADSATGPIADYALGVAMISASAGWSMFRAKIAHTRWRRPGRS